MKGKRGRRRRKETVDEGGMKRAHRREEIKKETDERGKGDGKEKGRR